MACRGRCSAGRAGYTCTCDQGEPPQLFMGLMFIFMIVLVIWDIIAA